VPAGANSSSFAATVSSFSSAQTVALTASAGSATETFALQLNAAPQIGASGAVLSVNADTIAFGNVAVNTAATQSVTLSSSGSAALSISAATVAGSGFSLAENSLPVSLSSGQAITLNVQFDPTTTGAASGTLTIASNSSSGATTVIVLSGTGASGSYAVDLSWDAPSSSPDPVAGYNVYRSPSGASAYQQMNTSVVTQTTYEDTTVQVGQSYDYFVESVDASGVESAPSNTATAAVP
jgi:hypothetical protein